MVQFQDKDRLEALGLPEESLPSILEALAEGALPPLPKLSDGAGAQAQWLAQLLKSADELNPLQGTHILRAEDPRVQVEPATALANRVSNATEAARPSSSPWGRTTPTGAR